MWTSPGAIGSYAINLTVMSTSGGSGAAVVGVLVSNNPSGTTITLDSIAASPPTVLPGGGVTLTASVTYTGGGTLTYGWSAGAGTLSAPTGNPLTWTAPATVGNYLVNLTVTDGLGASASGVAGILVSYGTTGTVITSVNPNEVTAGDEIWVTGTGFGAIQGTSSLTVAGYTASILSWSDTLVRAIVPAGATTGSVLVLFTGGQSTPAQIVILWTQKNPQNLPICTAASSQFSPQIVSDGAGGAIMVWVDLRSGTSYDLFAQRVDSIGATLWTANGVVISTAVGDQLRPQIAPDGSGGAIIVWQDYLSATNYDIHVQRVNAAGSVQWTAGGVAVCTAPDIQESPQIVSDGSGGAILVWEDRRSGTRSDVYAQRVNDTGVIQWTTDGVAICTVANEQPFPQIAPDGSGGAIVVWQDRRSGANFDIYAQRVDSTGAAQWTTDGLAVSTAAGNQTNPEIIPDGSGGAIMVWSRGGMNWDIYAQRLDGAGSALWTTNGVAICTAGNNQISPQIVQDGSGGAVIVWNDYRTNPDIYAQRVNGAGAPLWTMDGVAICAAASNQHNPEIASDGAGGAIVVWYDLRSGMNVDVYAQRVSSSGEARWATDGVAICSAIGDQFLAQIAPNGWGGAIMVWEDRRGATPDIHAQGISLNGLQ